ncbi:GTP 3',8-cyclase MoaA [uncultured Ruminococcus sp.]|uniref:GTP 3',8-cyclase MoaA n=1 Tax=uncultured Ruminococcus sp. TaxID=165186 RepID=UPI0029315270|nr:GTP 3',8-cyclase MoaA [uncultured Ruminococcus sp.]
MKDSFGRKIEYLRLSVTDLCNYRCIYCMDEEGVEKKRHSDILSIEELTEIAEAAYSLGIRKIRLTGGEPLVRKGLITLCRNIRGISDDIELGITTNGSLLPNMAIDLKNAGVDRLNISLDTLNPKNFRIITRTGDQHQVIDGINAAIDAGFDNIKINTVLLGGINDSEVFDFIRLTEKIPVQVRFIELMPLGVVKNWDKNRFITVDLIEKYLRSAAVLKVDGVAKVYRLPNHRGTIGLIAPISNRFCASCNKIRITADGNLKSCLHSNSEISLRGLHGEDLINTIRQGILKKPLRHRLNEDCSATSRNMNEIGG